jgi:hypothetical protein
MSLSKDAILAADDAKVTPVEVPEWGGSVNVRVMSGVQLDAFQNCVAGARDKSGAINGRGLRAALVALAACDDAGAALFTEADIPALEVKSGVALQRVFDAAAKLNGLTKDEAEQARADFTTDRD